MKKISKLQPSAQPRPQNQNPANTSKKFLQNRNQNPPAGATPRKSYTRPQIPRPGPQHEDMNHGTSDKKTMLKVEPRKLQMHW